jgi:A/G-specific adenine glycosylase
MAIIAPIPVRRRLLTWFAKNSRALPWRRQRTPYRVWISEIMLQQTQVQQALPYYRRFLKEFPTLKKLAEAPLDQVLKAWEGMGYYARARNLHKAAKIILHHHRGVFPREYEQVRALPGIGPYTAAAILSIAFAQPYAVVDGNVLRVLSRLLAYKKEVKSVIGKKELQGVADELLSKKQPGIFNEAMMELGAMICMPTAPLCARCPLSSFCLAYKQGKQLHFPVRIPKKQRPHYQIAAAIIWHEEKILIARRPEQGLLGGLWEFPGGKLEPGETLEQAAVREVAEELGVEIKVRELFRCVDHAYTHFTIRLHAFHCDWIGGEPQTLACTDWRWVKPTELEEYAFPRANTKIIKQLLTMC